MTPNKHSDDSKQQRRRNWYRRTPPAQTEGQLSEQIRRLDPNDPKVIEACVIEWIQEIRRFFGEEDQR